MDLTGLQQQDAVGVQDLAGPPAGDPEQAGDVGAADQLDRGVEKLTHTLGAALLPRPEHGQQFADDRSEDHRQNDVDQGVARLTAESDRHRGRDAGDGKQRRGANRLGEPDEYEGHAVKGQERVQLSAGRAGHDAERSQP